MRTELAARYLGVMDGSGTREMQWREVSAKLAAPARARCGSLRGGVADAADPLRQALRKLGPVPRAVCQARRYANAILPCSRLCQALLLLVKDWPRSSLLSKMRVQPVCVEIECLELGTRP